MSISKFSIQQIKIEKEKSLEKGNQDENRADVNDYCDVA